MDELFLMAKLDNARIAVDIARRATARVDAASPHYHQAQITYLHAGLRDQLAEPTVH